MHDAQNGAGDPGFNPGRDFFSNLWNGPFDGKYLLNCFSNGNDYFHSDWMSEDILVFDWQGASFSKPKSDSTLFQLTKQLKQIVSTDWLLQKMEKSWEKFPDRDWTRDLRRGFKSRALHSVQSPASRWVAERPHRVCKAQRLDEWQRGFTECAKPRVSMSDREASQSVQSPGSRWVAERPHRVCKAQCLDEWQRGLTQFKKRKWRSLIFGNLGGSTQGGGSTRVVYFVPWFSRYYY